MSEAAWDDFVTSQPDASRYHRWRWRRVFENAFGHETRYLAALDQGRIVGTLPLVIFRSALFGRFAVSLPFVDYGGICAPDPRIGRMLVDEAAAIAAKQRLSHVELRHTVRHRPDLPVREHKVTMRLPLERDAARAWDVLDRKVRNQVRKAEKSGLTARVGGLEFLARFYDVFARNMRDLGTPVYSIKFFREVLAAFPESSRIFLVDQGDVTIGGAIALTDRDTFAVPWASSLREYRHLCPNNLVYWRMIEHAIGRGCATFDFGRSTAHEGTYQFKQQWGAQPDALHWEYVLRGRAALPNLSPADSRFSAAISIWKRLPLSLTNRIGPHIVRSIP